MAEGVALDGFARSLAFGDDGVEAGAFADEQGDEACLVHRRAQPLGLGFEIEGDLGQVEAVDVLQLACSS